MSARFLGIFLVASGVVLIADSEFDHVVKAIEVHYHTKRTHIPFLGVANVFVKVAHPAGASEFKLAIFEDLKSIGEEDAAKNTHVAESGRIHGATANLSTSMRTMTRRAPPAC